jgi:hypothetical protein
MIDYYLHKKCPLRIYITSKQKENIRCNGCIWLDKELKKCVFSLEYPNSIPIEELKKRINSINIFQQNKLSEPFRRFINN